MRVQHSVVGVFFALAIIIVLFIYYGNLRKPLPFTVYKINVPFSSTYTNNEQTPQSQEPRLTYQNSHREVESGLDFYDTLKLCSKNIKLDTQQLNHHIICNCLLPFTLLEPIVTINDSCKPPPLEEPDCTETAFSGKRERPAKIAHSIKLGFDADTLEIHLNEIYDIVDYFIIVESVVSHQKSVHKPLVWEKIKTQKRFERFAKKVLHFILDDADVSEISQHDMWSSERIQEKDRWVKFNTWNERTQYFSDDDIIGFGDADEVASRHVVNKLKMCKFSSRSIDVGIWFPMGRLNTSFHSDYPVRGYPYSIGNPTFWSIGKAKENFARGTTPSYMRGTSGSFVLGGMHMSEYQYFPFFLTRIITSTEGKLISRSQLTRWSKLSFKGLFNEIDYRRTKFSSRIISLKQLFSRDNHYSKVVYVPWFLQCNLERYPAWRALPDSRYHIKLIPQFHDIF